MQGAIVVASKSPIESANPMSGAVENSISDSISHCWMAPSLPKLAVLKERSGRFEASIPIPRAA